MAVCDHPIARAQDLIDRLKSLTRPVGDAEAKDLHAVWNELEDLLVMLASKPGLAHKKKIDTLDTIIAAIDELRTTETKDADSDTQSRRGAGGRRSGNDHSTGS